MREGGGLLQFCEDAVESCAGAAGGGEGEPGSFVGHCGRGEMLYGGIGEWAVFVAEVVRERRGEGVTIKINSAILYNIIVKIMQGLGEVN